MSIITSYSSMEILGSTKLFSVSSKTEKELNAEHGYHIAIQYMTPAKIDQDLKNLAKAGLVKTRI